MLTNYPIDLDQKLLHGLIRMGACPIHSCLIDTNASKHDIWSVRDIDAKDADELGDGLPQRLESSSHQPEWQLMCQQPKHVAEPGAPYGGSVSYHRKAAPNSNMVEFSSQKRSTSVKSMWDLDFM